MNIAFLNVNWSQILITLLTCGIIILIAFVVFAITKKVIHRAFRPSENLSDGKKKRIHTLQSLLINLAGYMIFFIALVAILDKFSIDATGIIASAGILGLAIGFGAKDLVSDVVTGFFVLLEDQVNVGESVTVNGFSGTIEKVGLRILTIRASNGDLHFIPNRDIKALTNHSRGPKEAIIDLAVPAKADIDQVIALLQQECNQINQRVASILEGPHVLGLQQFSGDEALIRVQVRTENGQQATVERELRKDLKKALDQAQIT